MGSHLDKPYDPEVRNMDRWFFRPRKHAPPVQALRPYRSSFGGMYEAAREQFRKMAEARVKLAGWMR